MSRQVVLDTETTGLETSQGHRIIEIGCVELINRRLTGRHYHQYVNPEREIDAGAMEVHGITNEFVQDKPVFGAIADEFLEFIHGAELVIHNAPFDVGFIDTELKLLRRKESIKDSCAIIDSLVMARQKHPGQRNSLNALCQRYGVDNSQRDLHGALLDAEILADVYLLMTGGQIGLTLAGEGANAGGGPEIANEIRRIKAGRQPLPVLRATDAELSAHQEQLEVIDKASDGNCRWLQ
ncbi:MAG: DNA polymerase-3 subunit epsilon [Bermanella sp.]